MNKIRDTHKDNPVVKKERKKRELIIDKHKALKTQKTHKEIIKATEKIIMRNQKQLMRFSKKQWIAWEKNIRHSLDIKQTKQTLKKHWLLYWKKKALEQFQKRARGSLYSNTQGGHIFSKHVYPHIAFHEDNCHAITPMENKRQGDQIWSWRPRYLSQHQFDELQSLADDVDKKRVRIELKQDQKIEFYKKKYQKYLSLNKLITWQTKTTSTSP